MSERRETDREYITRTAASRPMKGGRVEIWNIDGTMFNPRRQIGKIPVEEFDLAKVSYILGTGRYSFRFRDATGVQIGSADYEVLPVRRAARKSK